MNIPLEKVLGHQQVSKVLFNENSFLPARNNNQLYASGYYNEIDCFVNLCENKKAGNLTSLSDLIPTYQTIQDLIKRV
jgi:hypothetical protein